jgi:hypothetical protein
MAGAANDSVLRDASGQYKTEVLVWRPGFNRFRTEAPLSSAVGRKPLLLRATKLQPPAVDSAPQMRLAAAWSP